MLWEPDNIDDWVECPECGGLGTIYLPEDSMKECDTCDGVGAVLKPEKNKKEVKP